jgi:DNA topoisomerase-3
MYAMLILTEKPSVAAAFAAALDAPRKGPAWENQDYCVVSALGHLLENYAPEDYDPALKKWSLQTLPVIPDAVLFKPVEKTAARLADVKACFDRRGNEPFLLATDAEREGELIGAEILQYAGFSNYENAKRFWVSEALTPEVILAGIKNARPLADYAPYREQGFARQEADWLAGMNLTRLVSLHAGRLFTFGRVQTAVLAAVYDREKDIASFSKEKYFEVKAVLGADAPFSVKLLNPDNPEFPARFPENSPVPGEIEKLKEAQTGTVTEIKKEKKTVHPPQLFNLTALQKEAFNAFSYTPEQTLDTAQSLYEKHKCLSYPRTPSRVMGDENVALVRAVFEKLKKHSPDMAAGADESLLSKDNRRAFNSAALQDHHALIPLDILPPDATEQEANVYNLVLKRFFTLFMPDFIYNAVKILVTIAGRLFAGSGVEPLQQGWKTGPGADGGDDDDAPPEIFSGLEEKEYPLRSIAAEEKFTEPKKRYTLSSLLSLMENPRGEDGSRLAGLGTPATRGGILKKLFDRKYLSQKGKSVLIEPDGTFLVENVRKNETLARFISIPETTRWEEELRADPRAFVAGIKDFVRRAVKTASMERYQAEKTFLGKCPLCGGGVCEGKKSYYCSNYKPRDAKNGGNGKDGCNFAIWKETAGAPVTPDDARLLLSGKPTKAKKCKSRAGKEFSASFILKNGKVEFRFQERKLKKS